MAISVIAVAMSLYHVYAIAVAPPEAMVFRGVHLAFAMVLVFLLFPWRSRGEEGSTGGRTGPLDWIGAVLSVIVVGYLLVEYEYVTTRIYYVDDLRPADWILGLLTILLVLEATRRVIGWALPLTAIVFLAWGLLVSKADPQLVVDQLYLTTEGIFGPTLGVSAAYVLVFVLFGSFMERTGIGQLFMDFALSLTGNTAGGPGKVSVVSSSLFGTISGSAVANVMVDGPITIPLMKRSGFRPHFAAGVEAVASTGGQIMPPIMGAAAFVMAEFLQVSYFQVTLWALIPALLYYVACFGAVHFEAKRQGLLGVPREMLPQLGRVMRERGHLFIPVAVILFGMMLSYSAPLCALAGTAATVPVALLRRATRAGITWRTIWDALEEGARNALSVAMACACAGIVIGMITLTGLGLTFTQLLVEISQETLILALVLTAAAGIVLGMGMPTTPAYIVMVSLLVPALIKLGVITPAAHMFAFYFAILSAITPPVALATFAAASLAQADLWKAGWASLKIGAAGFIVPFMFVYSPELLLIGEWPSVLRSIVTASIGILCLAAGLHGYFLRAAAPWERVALLVAAVLFVIPNWVLDLGGVALLGLVCAVQWAGRDRAATVAGPRPAA
jgi:TRAP transporter 4TM/12TM fusion protein